MLKLLEYIDHIPTIDTKSKRILQYYIIVMGNLKKNKITEQKIFYTVISKNDPFFIFILT